MVLLEVKIHPSPDAPSLARRCVGALNAELDDETIADAQLLVSELVTNSIRHAGLAPDDQITVNVHSTDGTVRLEVRDPGRGFSPAARTATSPQGSGWGLYLLERVAARWGVDRNRGTRVWCEFARVQRRPRLRSTASSS